MCVGVGGGAVGEEETSAVEAGAGQCTDVAPGREVIVVTEEEGDSCRLCEVMVPVIHQVSIILLTCTPAYSGG